MKKRFEKRIQINSEVLSKISKIDEFKGKWHGSLGLNPHILEKLKASVIITSTGASTRIEGSKMNDQEIERFLHGMKSNPPENRDEEEVAGYADLLGRVFDNWKSIKLSENTILQFHKIFLQFSRKDKLHAGKYKTKENLVVMFNDKGKQIKIFEPTEPWLVKKEMDDVLYWANNAFEEKALHPLLIIANFIFEFLAIHPFEDGNGRLSRTLTNLLLLQCGYLYIPYVSLEEIIEERKPNYYSSLRQTQKRHKTNSEDISPWLLFFLDTLIEQIIRAQELINTDNPLKLLSPKQTEIYNLFSEEPLGVIDIRNKFAHIPEVTIKQVLKRLVTLKLIERIGLGRATKYIKI